MGRYSCELRTGDVLLFGRQGLMGRLITLFTGGDKSHAELVVVEGGRTWSVGAHSDGVWCRPVSSLLLRGERITVRRVPDGLPAPSGWRTRLVRLALSTVGVWRYNFRIFLRCAAWETLGAPAFDPDWGGLTDDELARRVRRVMCSQFVSWMLRRTAKCDPCPGWADRATTPDDLDQGEPACRLVTVAEALRLEVGL